MKKLLVFFMKPWRILLAMVLVVVGMELFCRYYLGLGDPPLLRYDPEFDHAFVGPRIYHRFGNTIEINTYGMRSREFQARRIDSAELRIMFCGDSVISGGSQVDQKELATDRIEKRIIKEYQRPAVVMNVSTGGWGIPNYWAYVRRFGTFEANLMVIVVSSHDFADAPTFDQLVGYNPDFPDKKPTFALEDVIVHYLPRYMPDWSGNPKFKMNPTQGQIDQSMDALSSLVKLAQSRNISVIVAQHLETTEYGKDETEGHAMLRKAITELRVPRVELSETFEPAMKAGGHPYRDSIHLTAEGQGVLENAIYPAMVKALADNGVTKAAGQ